MLDVRHLKKMMKQTKTRLFLALTITLLVNFASIAAPDQADFLSRIQEAFQTHDSTPLVESTLWTGVSEGDKQESIQRHKQQVELNMTRIEIKAAEDRYWRNFKKDGIEYSYNLPVTWQVVVHVEKGSKIELSFGEVPIRDIKMPVGEKDGQLYLLESKKVTNQD